MSIDRKIHKRLTIAQSVLNGVLPGTAAMIPGLLAADSDMQYKLEGASMFLAGYSAASFTKEALLYWYTRKKLNAVDGQVTGA